MYPSKPDYEGTRELPAPLLSSGVDELTDAGRRLNRIVFTSSGTVESLSHVDTTLHDTSAVDQLLQRGTVFCNI